MTQMRYYTADLLTDAIVAELPLYGVDMDKILNGAGNFTGTFQLNTGVDIDAQLIAGSIPGQQALFVERDGVCIWGGPLWVRTYQSTSATVQLQAQTFESVFEHIVMTTDQIFGAIEQNTILSNWLTAMMAQTNNDFGITYSGPGATGVTRTLQFLAVEYHTASELLQAISDSTDGMDYTINVTSPASKTFKATYSGAAPTSSGLVYEYPGQVSDYWYSESGLRGAVRAAGIGQGVTAEGTLGSSGSRPYFWQTQQLSDVSDTTLLQNKVNKLLQMPFISPTFELSSADDFSGWDKCGQNITVNVNDPRFPVGKAITSRMMGWSFSPEQSGSDESIKFVLETDT